MTKLKTFALAAAVAALGAIPTLLQAAPPLTTVRDTIYTANGSKFNGRVIIEWRSFEASDTTFIGRNRLELQIVDGFLNARLVPTTTAAEPAFYRVRFINAGGTLEFAETWAVKPAAESLRVRDVRIADPLLGPGQGGATAGPVTIADVEGLQGELEIRAKKGATFTAGRVATIGEDGDLESVVGATEDCVRVDGTSGPCGGGTISQYLAGSFVDGELPTGSINGSNRIFVLAQAPNPVGSLLLYRNGLLQRTTVDYTLSGNTITFLVAATPQSGDILVASYRTTGTSGTIPQMLCAATGVGTSNTNSTSLGTCTIPGGTLRAGDRVEIAFDLAHAGATVGFTYSVLWGATTAGTYTAPAAATAGTGRVSLGIYTGGAMWSSQSWAAGGTMGASAGNTIEALENPITIDFRGQLASASTDTVTLRNFTVLRIQAP